MFIYSVCSESFFAVLWLLCDEVCWVSIVFRALPQNCARHFRVIQWEVF